jgi:hypothetical protein
MQTRVALAIAALALTGLRAAAQKPFRSRADLVEVDAIVVDHDGRIVADADLAQQIARVPQRRKTLVCIGPASVFSASEPVGMHGDTAYSGEWSDAVRGAAPLERQRLCRRPCWSHWSIEVHVKRPGVQVRARRTRS